MKRLYFFLSIFVISCSSNRTLPDTSNLDNCKGEITQISKLDNSPFYKSSIAGIIIDHDSKELLPYVQIKLSSAFKSYETNSDSSGTFNFCELNSGNYKIEFYYLGYYPFVDSLFLEIGKNNNIKIDLYKDPKNSILY